MAVVVSGSQVKLNNGQVVQAQQGGWYDGQQFWAGTLSAPGVINSNSNQVGAGQAVSKEVIAQTNPNNVAYIQQQQQNYQPSATSQPLPSSSNSPSIPSGEASIAGGGTGIGIAPPATINLPQLYESLYQNSGIRDIEANLSKMTTDFNTQVAKIKNNPFLSEATQTGRISKLQDKFNADTANIKNDIATKKADIEMQLNLQTKQFDINSQAAQQAWQQFDSLLNSGALANASGEDIANLTRSTGLSSAMITSAIQAANKKNNPVSISQIDDGNNVYAVAIDSNGNVVNKQVISASAKTTKGGSGLTADQKNQQQKNQIIQEFQKDAQGGYTLSQLFQLYAGILPANDIYTLYNTYSKYGADKNKNATKGTGYLSEYGVTLYK